MTCICASYVELTAAACLAFSWDDSSSVSSGLSDTLDNISTDDLNTTSSVSSYSNITIPSRKSTQVRIAFSLFPVLLPVFSPNYVISDLNVAQALNLK